MWHFRHPLDFVGSDGGGGIGAGPGITVGGAIALKGTARLPVSILGDGDYLMGVNALWTAANAGVPLLAVIVATTARSSTTRCTRSASRRSAAARSRTAGSASASTSPHPTSACSRARRASTASAR